MDIPPGWQETKLPPNPDVKKLRTFLGKWYDKSGRQDEENFEIQRRGQDRWFLISREAINQDEIRKAATKAIKLPTMPELTELSRPGTRDPDAPSQAREITTASSEPTRPDNTSPESARPPNDPMDHGPLRKATTMEILSSKWTMVKGLLGLRSHVGKKIGQ